MIGRVLRHIKNLVVDRHLPFAHTLQINHVRPKLSPVPSHGHNASHPQNDKLQATDLSLEFPSMLSYVTGIVFIVCHLGLWNEPV